MARASTQSSSPKTSQLILSQAISIGSFKLRIYSLTMLAAVLSAYFIARYRALKAGISDKNFDDIAFWAIVVGFISARIYYVLTYFNLYRYNLPEILKVWHGGLSIYGALIGGALTVWYFCRRRQINFLNFADLIVVGIPLAQAIGRLGNYFNYEAFGAPTNLPWKMFVPAEFRPTPYLDYQYFHPTFAYEIIWNLIVFGVLWFVSKKAAVKIQKPGFILSLYVLLYSIGRFFIEGLRLDSAYIWGFRTDQVIALLLIIGSLAIIINRYVSQARK